MVCINEGIGPRGELARSTTISGPSMPMMAAINSQEVIRDRRNSASLPYLVTCSRAAALSALKPISVSSSRAGPQLKTRRNGASSQLG
jgi:hypothetical protein